jgi:hypothetical protein
MASHGHEGESGRNLSVTWPFTVGGVILIAALVIFCGHYATLDTRTKNPGIISSFSTVFWVMILIAVVLAVLGGIYNVVQRRRRLRAADGGQPA